MPPNSATAIEYGTPRPAARMAVGNISAYTAGAIETNPPMQISAIVMATASSTALFPIIAFSGISSTAMVAQAISRTGRLPMRSDSIPHSGSTPMKITWATTPAHSAPLASMPRLVMANDGAATAQT